jgi:hypothetical protein
VSRGEEALLDSSFLSDSLVYPEDDCINESFISVHSSSTKENTKVQTNSTLTLYPPSDTRTPIRLLQNETLVDISPSLSPSERIERTYSSNFAALTNQTPLLHSLSIKRIELFAAPFPGTPIRMTVCISRWHFLTNVHFQLEQDASFGKAGSMETQN